ncbi:ABC transporter substrate-binding protein [Thermoleophilia bacterium SCSIO 60948]|nr:ABC transporter substrate-binding protein [Thermoleophilia bacterium SCSIO 60948]
MKRIATALLAALAIAAGGCGGEGAEPGAADAATLVLDFQPNAVHAGIYAGLASDCFEPIELEVREPSSSQDSAKLLAAGQVEFAVLDIHDVALARERGLDLTIVAALVQRPLAAVIAGDRDSVRTPADLDGERVGVTGLPSDEAVLDAVSEAGGGDPASIERIAIGFDSVAAVSADRVAAATAFWNAEGVALREDLDVPTREFRVDDYGAPRYPELVVATARETVANEPGLVRELADGIACGYRAAVEDPDAALTALTDAVPELDPATQSDQLAALGEAAAFGSDASAGTVDPRAIREWARWDLETGIVERPIDVGAVLEGTRGG